MKKKKETSIQKRETGGIEKQRDLTELVQAFNEIQMSRTPYILENMVVNSKFTEEQRYAQCVLELSIAYDNLRLVELQLERKQIQIDKINKKGRTGEIKKEIKKIQIEQTQRAVLGAMREFECLYNLWLKFPKKFTRDEINQAQELEYTKRLETQANQDMNAIGRITQSNQEGLRQIGKLVYPELDIIRDVEKKFLKEGKSRILLAVATEFKAEKGLPCIEGLTTPNGSEIKIYNSWGRKIEDSYNHIVQVALEDKADYIITVEDDTFPPEDALIKLLNLLRKNPKSAVGAWYPKKEKSKQGVHIVVKDGKRQQLDVDGNVHEVYTLAMGCSIYPIEMFMDIPYPWFKTGISLTQDSFFSQLAREHGWKLLVDTSIRCKHIDRITREVFAYDDEPKEVRSMQVKEELNELLNYVKGKELILEIGTAQGGTLFQMMKVASDNAEFVSIDLPNGKFGGEFGQPDMKEMQSWLKEKQNLHIIRADSKSFLTVKKVNEILNGRKFDFIFIDGDHTYEAVKEDYEIYKEFAGNIIAFHDIVEHNQPEVGVKRLWEEIKGDKIEIIKDKNQGWAGIGILKI